MVYPPPLVILPNPEAPSIGKILLCGVRKGLGTPPSPLRRSWGGGGVAPATPFGPAGRLEFL